MNTRTIPLATPSQVAEFLQLGTDRLSAMRSSGTGPRFVKIGRDVRYSWRDVDAFIAGNAQTITGTL
jgi:predicted DNA-binding transcriptional regulator AlpA